MLFKQLETRIGGAQVNYHFNFSIRNRYIYVQTSKCGCTYLKSSLTRVELSSKRFFDSEYRYTDPRFVVPDALGKTPHQPVNRSVFIKPYQLGVAAFEHFLSAPGYFKFAVVRNPYSRVLSAYLDTVGRNRPPFHTLKADLASIKGMQPAEINPNNVSFQDFLSAIERRVQEKGWRHVDQHYRLQTHHLSDDLIAYDRIFKLEQFPEALEEISSRIGVRLPEADRGPHQTDSSSRMATFYADTACSKLVASIYQDDLRRFGYEAPAGI